MVECNKIGYNIHNISYEEKKELSYERANQYRDGNLSR